MSQLTYLPSKSERAECANNIVAALAEIEDIWHKDSDGWTFGSIQRQQAEGIIRRDGTCQLNLTPRGSWDKLASNHRVLTASQRVADMEDAFSKFARKLTRLLPSQALSWKYLSEGSGQHELYLGHTDTSTPKGIKPIISTARSRWKAPILRLTDYLSDPNFTPHAELERWHFLRPRATGASNMIGAISTHTVIAPNFAQAMRLAGFISFKAQSTPAPEAIMSNHVFKVGKHIETEPIEDSLNRVIASMQDEMQQKEESLANEIHEQLEGLTHALDSLTTEVSTSITINLLDGSVELEVIEHPLLAQSDLIAGRRSRDKVAAICEVIAKILVQRINAVHPCCQSATLVVLASNSTLTTPSHHSYKLEIDGLTRDLNSHQLPSLIQEAMRMSLVVNSEKIYHYMFSRQARAGPDQEIEVSTPVLLRASSAEHAYLLYHDKDNRERIATHGLIFNEIHPVERQKWIEAQAHVSERIKDIYAK